MHLRRQKADALALKQAGLDHRECLVRRPGVFFGPSLWSLRAERLRLHAAQVAVARDLAPERPSHRRQLVIVLERHQRIALELLIIDVLGIEDFPSIRGFPDSSRKIN